MALPGFHRLSHGHQDLILAFDYNLYGNRVVTASSDHRLRVWTRNDESGAWTVTDTWTAHDAEVIDVKWNGPFVGEHLGTIGEDGFVRVWQEDVNEAIGSGRRFKKIFERPSDTGVPYMSLDFKNIGTETFLALATRDGYLTILEPEDYDDLSVWRIFWAEQLCKTPPRTEETAFRLSWHKERLPAWPAVLAGLDRKSLSLAVAIGDEVRVFRTDRERRLYTAATLEGATGLVRDVAWADGSMRGFDLIATASKDGYIRVYELHTPGASSLSTSIQSQISNGDSSQVNGHSTRPVRSGIGAGLANSNRGRRDDNLVAAGTVKQESKLIATLEAHEGVPWRVGWSQVTDIVFTSGDNGTVQLWKRAVDGKWLDAAEIDATKDS
ncbi:WD40-repeat-containing domain protein [Neohortaea acidophila]|uniref:WD40-repeat-containing domain protein n=1 Tax=Neohortaea acidophila TaxID=245834 RepID=A0A6A6Q156_9PEZI|nr:WD40-repeat-containing domain protein [Neohortaea acidophila]KAF2485157.1 WD40-repeat-containing domain protein [Neohortaea acidophila]